jgi:hypothetical protein
MKNTIIKTTIQILITIVPLVSFAETVSNIRYIEKQIELIQEEADFSYDEIQNFFDEDLAFNTTCFRNEAKEKEVDARFNKFRPVPKNYLHTFKLTEKKLGFDLHAAVTVQDKSETAAYDQDIYSADQNLDCLGSKKGCSNFYFEAPKETLTRDPEDEENVELSKNWRFHIADSHLMYAEYSIELSASKKTWLGANAGTSSHRESYLCVMEKLQEI